MEKVAFMKKFPGLSLNWDSLVGKTIEHVTSIKGTAGAAVLVFDDGSFVVTAPLNPDPSDLREALHHARHHLEPKHPQAYAEYDRLAAKDKAAQRAARLENIIGAIHNNLPQIPELKDRLKELVKEWK
ncbi:MAG: hypothetical protein ABW047_01510 [Nitrospiraceae bacterium]